MAKIMVVEDEERYMAQIAEIAERAGHSVVKCYYGGSAADVYDREVPDMVVTDFSCGITTGVDVTRQIRERGSEVPVYIQSMRSIPGGLVARSGANGFILKGNLDAELPPVIRKHFGGRE
ncbi:MAG: response regulator [Candidatus Aenigmarchaeota archaeon]|nr:response regulator [Candidatus Aenigmarchaeota archaeon]